MPCTGHGVHRNRIGLMTPTQFARRRRESPIHPECNPIARGYRYFTRKFGLVTIRPLSGHNRAYFGRSFWKSRRYTRRGLDVVSGRFLGIRFMFLAGTEIDTDLMREKFTESFLIGFLSFLVPFIGVFLFAYFGAQWGLEASLLIAATALSTTSLAVVYSVLVETNLSGTDVGKLLMASTFVTDMATAIALSVLFIKPTVYTAVFIAVSVVVIVLAAKFSTSCLTTRR